MSSCHALRRRALRCGPLALILMAAPSYASSQEHAHAHEGAELGRVDFPVSCNAEASRRFEHAMGVLHSFWWEEGDNAFGAVLQADSTCSMAYWGMALIAWGNPFAGGPSGPGLAHGAAAAAKAGTARPRTPREAGFLAAAAALYRNADSTTNAVRLKAYADTMARVYRDFPKDAEVAIYHALALIATAPRTDTTFAQQRKAAAILNPLFVQHPDHPGLAHYIIHANDSPQLAPLGLDAARRYATIAPAAPHAQHMPTHIFVRLGLWDETVSSNWRSYQTGVASAEGGTQKVVNYEQFHALDYAVYAHLQRGRDSAARALVDTARTVTAAPTGNVMIDGYNRRAMEARLVLEPGDWHGAAEFPGFGPNDASVVAALSCFTRGLGAARSGAIAQARREVASLDSIADAIHTRPDPYWERIVRIKRDVVESWIRFADGDSANGLALAHTAADAEEITDKHPVTPAELLPARELEADMLLAAGRYGEAQAAYQKTLRREVGRARSTFGMARAAELSGDRDAAESGYRAFLTLMEPSDGTRPELATARAYRPR